jgi:hypothetical protein
MDAFLKISRPLKYKKEHEWMVNFQHDLVEQGVSYGFNITNKGLAGMGGSTVGYFTDVTEQWVKTNKPRATFYVEQKVFGNMKLRLDLKNILKAKTAYQKTKYNGNISQNSVLFNEFRKASEQRIFKLTLQGTF